MPFTELTRAELQSYLPLCFDSEHYPSEKPAGVLPQRWHCPSCGQSFIVQPSPSLDTPLPDEGEDTIDIPTVEIAMEVEPTKEEE